LFDPGSLSRVPPRAAAAARTVLIQTHYDGIDLDAFGLAREEVVRLHSQAEWTVAFLGFAPGFAYLSGAPPELTVPRLTTPRVRVPAGSVAVAGGYGGIYPAASPGGWRLLGRTARRLFDLAATPPALLRPGDRVVFQPVGALDPGPPLPPREPEGAPVLRVISPGAHTSVQGAPRDGFGGAMDLPALALANRQVGNEPGAAGLEITLVGPELEALAPVRLSSGGELRTGERLQLGAVRQGVREYLAIGGGLVAPAQPLRAGDVLYRANSTARAESTARADSTARAGAVAPARGADPGGAVPFSGVLRAMPGPQLDFFTEAAIASFFESEYRVSPQSDRRGLRLLGDALALSRAPDLPPEGTAPGAVQVPGDGLPIVLGPDRPITGGYPKIATVISADLHHLAQLRPGTALRFRRVSLAEALAARGDKT
jgi:biotin-dependent carboxylase-like uncharacterized protein